MADNDAFAAEFARIQQQFLRQLQGWLPAFTAFAAAIEKAEPSSSDDIAMKLHKLAGSAKTFGYGNLNQYAARAEQCLRQWAEAKKPESACRELQLALEDFLKEAQRRVKHDLKTSESTSPTPQAQEAASFLYQVIAADDDDLVQQLLAHGLQKEQCRILPAASGKRVLELVKQSTPDLIILDVNMPELNGFDTLKALKAAPETQAIPVIMLTKRDEDENILKGITGGALDYITKPFEVTELVRRVVATLRRIKIKILVADDDALIRELLQHRFHRMGYTVLLAEHGQQVLELMRTETPDIVVLDVMMPAMDGISVLKQAKKDTTLAEIPIILLTAKNQQENILKGLEGGAHDYITKPFDVDEVAARVQGILLRRKKL